MKAKNIRFIQPVRDPQTNRLAEHFTVSRGHEIEVHERYVTITHAGKSLSTNVQWHSAELEPEPAPVVQKVEAVEDKPRAESAPKPRGRRAKATNKPT